MVEQTTSLRAAALTGIRQRIIRGELPGRNSFFSEPELCAMLGMSRAPIREALAVLTETGWVTSAPRAGYAVVPTSLADLNDLFAVRLLIEPKAAELASQTLRTAPEEREILHLFAVEQDDPSLDTWLDAHYRFHRRIGILSLNRTLDRTLNDVLLKLERYLVLDHLRNELVQRRVDHRRLSEALLSGDGRAAADQAELHVLYAQRVVTDAFLAFQARQNLPTIPGASASTDRNF